MEKIFVVIPNWNGADMIATCLQSLQRQTQAHTIVIVDNGSKDNSTELIATQFPDVHLIALPRNTGFAGGVNTGIRFALEHQAEAVALLNNDAVAEPDWLEQLVAELHAHPTAGIATGKLLLNHTTIDSTGDFYTTWGLPYPRGRGETKITAYDHQVEIFGASGGASIYRSEMLMRVGLFDEDFFAYFEDVDISFRAQLAGWKIRFVPTAVAYHQQGATSSRIKGFTTYQTIKNYPLLLWKNVPLRLMPTILPRFALAYITVLLKSLLSSRFWPAFKGWLRMLTLLPKKTIERWRIQSKRSVTSQYIRSILTHDLPPNATKLRSLRRRFTGK